MLALTAAETLKGAGGIVLVILVVVGFHEAGHFVMAKWSGIRVDEFSIGFGPKLFSRRRGETLYAIRALPLGGFVKMPGMTDLEQTDAGDRAFNRASIPRRSVTILAGVTANLVLAGVLFTVESVPDVPSQVPVGSAVHGRVPDGALIVRVAGHAVDTTSDAGEQSDIAAALQSSSGAPIDVVYRTGDGTEHTAHGVRPFLRLFVGVPGDLATRLDELIGRADSDNPLSSAVVVDTVEGQPVHPGDPASLFTPPPGAGDVAITGHIASDPALAFSGRVANVVDGSGEAGRIEAAWKFGILLYHHGESIPSALGSGFLRVPRGLSSIVTGLHDAFTGSNGAGLSSFRGPVGIGKDVAQTTRTGWLDYVDLMGFISLNLGFVNVLPVPFLDGGRFTLLMVEAVRRKRMDPRRELALVVAGAMLIITFVVLVTINDIKGT